VVGIGERAFIGPLLGETVVGFIVVGICDGAFDCAIVGEIVVGFIIVGFNEGEVVGLNASESEGEVVGKLVGQVPQVTGQLFCTSFS